MNLDQIDGLLVDALPWLSVTVFPLLLILAAVFGSEAHRLGADTQHDISDLRPSPAPVRERRRLRRVPVPSETPIHDGMVGLRMSDETARAVARVWLEDIAAVEQAKAGIRPAVVSPATDRDYTGAFPVVRAA